MNKEHLAILNQGVDAWYQWRRKNPSVTPDLSGAILVKADLSDADLREADLRTAILSKADLSDADLRGAKLFQANLSGANLHGTILREAEDAVQRTIYVMLEKETVLGLSSPVYQEVNRLKWESAPPNHLKTRITKDLISLLTKEHVPYAIEEVSGSEADLSGANLREADLRRAILSGADLIGADLRRAILSEADLSEADLSEADLRGANLRGADLNKAVVMGTVFVGLDLRTVKGLETMTHGGPSYIGIETIYRSGGEIPEIFLRGAGVPDEFIAYMKSLVGKPIQFYSLFISYSTKDQEFADRLHADLQARGVRCWFAPHDVQGGKKLHEQIDEAIRVYDKLLLILSEASMKSEWVAEEIARARKRERREGRRMLFPISIVPYDETIRDWECFDADSGKDSAREIREYFIPDFSRWKDHDSYQQAFDRLLRDLETIASAK